MRYLPVNLDIAGRRVLVVGGGQVAARKVKTLRACGALVTVVSPVFAPGLTRMKGITRIKRGYRKTDLRGVSLVVSAAGPQDVNRRAWEHARAAGIPINVVDQPDLCTFTVPAVLTRGDLVITISTGGGSPALSGRIREILTATIGPEFGRHVRLLRSMRTRVKASALPLEARSELLKAMAQDGIRETIRQQGLGAARQVLEAMLAEALGKDRRAAGREAGLPQPAAPDPSGP